MHAFQRNALVLLAAAALVSLTGSATTAAQPSSAVAARRAAPEWETKLVEAQGPAGIAAAAIRSSAPRLTLRAPDGRSLVLVRERQERIGKQGNAWAGRVADDPASSAILVENQGAVAGTIFTRAGVYEVRGAPDRTVVIQKIDTSRFPKDAEPTPRSGLRGDKTADPSADSCSTDAGDNIDVMVIYTDDARAAAGGTAAMEAEVYLAIEVTNQSYLNSNINQRVRLVHVAEVDYAESFNTLTDRNALQSKTDGILDQVHAWRDTYGADSVMMIAQRYDDNCGRSYVMTSVGNAFEDSAFGVTSRSCASANLSFPHELAHQMGARHDWPNDSTDNSPYHFNHGYVVPGVFRTVMAYPCAGGTCPRIAQFSNPSVSVGANATGTSSEPQPTDNAQVLNATAQTVANFRCSSPGRGDVWAKDRWNDTGAEPDPNTAGQPMWESPYIWVRNSQDTNLLHQHEHQDPEFGSPNWAYVKLHNGAAAPASGTLHLYYGAASTGLIWPGSFTEIGAIPVTLNAHSTRVIEFPWSGLPGTGHYCLIARWVSPADPMHSEGPDINANTIANNNIVWRNLNIVDLADHSMDSFVVRVRAPDDPRRRGLTMLRFVTPPNANGRSLGEVATVAVEPLGEAQRLFAAARPSGLERGQKGWTLARRANGEFRGIALAPGQEAQLRITLRRAGAKVPPDVFRLRVEQWLEPQVLTAVIPPRVVGGVTYDITTGRGRTFFAQRAR